MSRSTFSRGSSALLVYPGGTQRRAGKAQPSRIAASAVRDSDRGDAAEDFASVNSTVFQLDTTRTLLDHKENTTRPRLEPYCKSK